MTRSTKRKCPPTSPRAPLFELPSPFLGDEGLLRLLEPHDSRGEELSERLISGRYDKPFLLERDGVRYLYFSLRFIQSAMRLDEPDLLDLLYTQKMMAFLLFNPRPRSLVLLGLGGGSLAKFCYRHLPETRIVTLELNPHVIALRDEFLVPPDDHRFSVIHGDGAQYVAEAEGRSDVMLVDAFDEVGVAPSLSDGTFFAQVHRHLSDDGVLVMNLAGDKTASAAIVEQIHQHFGEQVIAISVRDDANYVVFAFKRPGFEPNWKWLRGTAAPELRARIGLDFEQIARQLERGQRLRLARRIAA